MQCVITRGSAWDFESLLYCADGGHKVRTNGKVAHSNQAVHKNEALLTC
jgi:hypothetical protein